MLSPPPLWLLVLSSLAAFGSERRSSCWGWLVVATARPVRLLPLRSSANLEVEFSGSDPILFFFFFLPDQDPEKQCQLILNLYPDIKILNNYTALPKLSIFKRRLRLPAPHKLEKRLWLHINWKNGSGSTSHKNTRLQLHNTKLSQLLYVLCDFTTF